MQVMSDSKESTPSPGTPPPAKLQKFLPSPRPLLASASSSALIATMKQHLEEVLAIPEASSLAAESKINNICQFYQTLIPEDKAHFLKILSKDYSVNQKHVFMVTNSLEVMKDRGDGPLLKVEDRLRNVLVPQYQHFFTQISRQEKGVKFLVDVRADLLSISQSNGPSRENPHLQAMSLCLRDLLSLWFSVGFLDLERITWESPCDMLQKISEYEAVHPIRNWLDLKRRVGSYRRCYVFTHRSMPREPVVVLHTALASDIPSSIQSIVKRYRFDGNSNEASENRVAEPDSSMNIGISAKLQDDGLEDPNIINTAVFYSITSTQKGLLGVDMGNYLIRSVVRELLKEFPNMNQFSSLSPIPGFRDWLIGEINKVIHVPDQCVDVRSTRTEQLLFTDAEFKQLQELLCTNEVTVFEQLRKLLISNTWVNNEHLVNVLQVPLSRLCARYLYVEKRRGNALNPVATFHLRNGAVMWRINWLADKTPRGLSAACGFMVNYRYFLEQTQTNSKLYIDQQYITASDQILDFVNQLPKITTLSDNAS